MPDMRKLVILLLMLLLSACQPAKDPNTIVFSTWGSPIEMDILNPLLDQFRKENPEITLKVLHVPDKYFQKMHALLAANIAPDVLFLNNINFPIYASNESFLDLEPYLQKSASLKASDFYPQTLEGFRWQGKLQGIPRDASNLVVFYNQELFDKAGLPYPKDGWTYDEMIEIARKLTVDADGDKHPEQFGMSFDKRSLFWLPYVWSAGGDIFNADRSEFMLTKPEALKGLQLAADLRHKHHVAPTSAEAGSAAMAQLFTQKKLAMLLTGRWSVTTFRKDVPFKWDIAPFPKGPAGSIVDADASGWVISKTCPAPDKAWKLIEFLASKQVSEAFTKPGLIIPARKDVAESDVFLAPGEQPKRAKVFIDALQTGRPMPTMPYWNVVTDELDQALEPVWEGRETPEVALKNIEAKIKPLL